MIISNKICDLKASLFELAFFLHFHDKFSGNNALIVQITYIFIICKKLKICQVFDKENKMAEEKFYVLRQNQQFSDNLFSCGCKKPIESADKNIRYITSDNSDNPEFILRLTKTEQLKPSNIMFLIMLLSQLSERGIDQYYTQAFSLSFKDYILLREENPEKQQKKIEAKQFNKVRGKIKEDLNTLFNMAIALKYYDKSLDENMVFKFRIISSYGIKNNNLTVNFTPEFLNYYQSIKYVMYLPKDFFKIDVRYNPNSFLMGVKLVSHYNINNNKLNQRNKNILGVKTLLKYCPKIPKYDDEFKSNGGLNQRIIQPFVRDLDKLNTLNIIDWYFLDENNNVVDKNSIKNYIDFIKLKVRFDWKVGYEPPKSKKITNLLCE